MNVTAHKHIAVTVGRRHRVTCCLNAAFSASSWGFGLRGYTISFRKFISLVRSLADLAAIERHLEIFSQTLRLVRLCKAGECAGLQCS
jgi:hypothetical protein